MTVLRWQARPTAKSAERAKFGDLVRGTCVVEYIGSAFCGVIGLGSAQRQSAALVSAVSTYCTYIASLVANNNGHAGSSPIINHFRHW